ncbi:MAG TPA: class I SAM-dependent methyltransferase [Candidatus Binatia bacterium]|jgi:SAM-dependent methyltransferase|nr:class I SAM-dependent methyltransferase [Candidatus Binatia bacterium]
MAHSTDLFPIEEDPFFLEDLLQMARAGNFRRWQFAMVAPYITGKVLEVGGGIGNFTPELARVAESVVSIEPNAYCFARLQEKTKDLANVRVCNATVESLDQQLPPEDRRDTIVLMNVLEHIKDDAAVLQLLRRRLKPDGRIVLLVPAAPWAFGHIDERLGHYRRYSKASARQLIAALGMQVEKLRYFNFIGVWAWWWNARISKTRKQNDAQIRVFDRYFVPCISRVENVVAPPVGQSLLLVARQHPG